MKNIVVCERVREGGIQRGRQQGPKLFDSLKKLFKVCEKLTYICGLRSIICMRSRVANKFIERCAVVTLNEGLTKIKGPRRNRKFVKYLSVDWYRGNQFRVDRDNFKLVSLTDCVVSIPTTSISFRTRKQRTHYSPCLSIIRQHLTVTVTIVNLYWTVLEIKRSFLSSILKSINLTQS